MNTQGSHTPQEADIQAIVAKLKTPSKPQLQSICVVNGLPKTGNKADLSHRIEKLLKECAKEQDIQKYNEVRNSIYRQTGATMPPPYYTPGAAAPQPPIATNSRYGPAIPNNGFPLGNGARSTPPGLTLPSVNNLVRGPLPRPVVPNSSDVQFRTTPFFDRKMRMHDLKICESVPAHRNSVSWRISAQELQLCAGDPSMRLLVFCAGGNTGTQDISFPHQSELKVNGGEVKANLRGLKNKPGSTRPADITTYLRLKPGNYVNVIEFTYALTNKKYFIELVLCKATPVDVLVTRIQKKIRKESVVAELAQKAHDPDIEATSLNLSLKCPLSYSRLNRPCRGLSCSHIQCFDATSYLQLQEQGPQWLCPICNKSVPFEQLAVDEYVRDILTRTSDSVEQVTIEPNGTWALPGAKRESRSLPNGSSLLDLDDFEIDVKPNMNKTPTSNRVYAPISLIGTPNTTASRDSSAPARSSSKRPAEVIDLTLSDDEDDDPRPAKRQNLDAYVGSLYPTFLQNLQQAPAHRQPQPTSSNPAEPANAHGQQQHPTTTEPPASPTALQQPTTEKSSGRSSPTILPLPLEEEDPTTATMSFEAVMPPYNATDPSARFLGSSCFDFLLIELVPMAYRVTHEVDAAALAAGGGVPEAGAAGEGGGAGNRASTILSGGGTAMDEEEERDAVFFRLERLGYRVGQGLVERFSRDRPRFNDTLDVIKFLCKDLWQLVFRKQVDNLKTNHRGVYVLTDNAFRPFARMSTETGGQAVARAQPFLYFPCGVVRGALAAMGINATVQAETSELPSAVFQIKTIPAKAP
ncbi:E3 SUMO-protein ligase pli1 [Podospora conica]|nr:E3 SUMO-protein ligase pli1 [Schizothecium conicum]